MSKQRTAIIIGGGPAGLTAAISLLDNKVDHPIILEQEGRVGGISATIEYNGNRMDLGGHRFFSKSDEVMNWWTSKLPLAKEQEQIHKDKIMLMRQRVSRIYYLRKFFDYPITIKWATFANMGFRRTVTCGFGFFHAKLFQRREHNLEDFMINRFGAPLYKMFFEDYTTKVWGLHPKEISPEWGAQRIKGLSLFSVLQQAMRNVWRKPADLGQKNVETSLIEQFLYPKYGPGQFWEAIADEIKERGGEVRLSTTIDKILYREGCPYAVETVSKTGEREILEGDVIFSSMPIKDLVAATYGMSVPTRIAELAAGLPYRDFITVGLLVEKIKLKDNKQMKGRLIPDCWIYIQENDVKIGRLQIFNNWSPYMVKDPDNTVWLGLEYFCNEGDVLWEMDDDKFIQLATSELVLLGIIDPEVVMDATRIKVKKAYPAYFGTYENFNEIQTWLDGIQNLYCMGRNGLHRYNNMDHSMLTAKEAVRLYLEDESDKSAIWSINSEESYHETKSVPSI